MDPIKRTVERFRAEIGATEQNSAQMEDTQYILIAYQ